MDTMQDVKRQLEKLWNQMGDQFEEAKDTVSKAYDHFKLESERDALLRKLGEQVHKLAIQEKVNLPDPVQRTISRIDNKVAEITRSKQAPASKKASAKKKAAVKKKAPAKRKTTGGK